MLTNSSHNIEIGLTDEDVLGFPKAHSTHYTWVVGKMVYFELNIFDLESIDWQYESPT